MNPLACKSLCINTVLNKAQQPVTIVGNLEHFVVTLFNFFPLPTPAKLAARFRCKHFTSSRKSYDVCKFHSADFHGLFPPNFSLSFYPLPLSVLSLLLPPLSLSLPLSLSPLSLSLNMYSLVHMNFPCPRHPLSR